MTETWRRMTWRKKGEIHEHTWESEHMRHVALPARRMYQILTWARVFRPSLSHAQVKGFSQSCKNSDLELIH